VLEGVVYLSLSLKSPQRTNNAVPQPLIQCLECFDRELCTYPQLDKYETIFGAMAREFSGSGVPADQVVKLWDFFLSQGSHLSVLATVSRVLLKRDYIMRGKR
jgi:hypothetical protein